MAGIRGSNTSKPTPNERTGQDDLLAKVEEKIKNLKTRVDEGAEAPQFLRALGGGLMGGNAPMGSNSGMPMNDSQLGESMEFNSKITMQNNSDQVLKEVISRLGEVEDRLPEFKGLNIWDVKIKPLPSSATLADVISTVNTLIQRSQRQDRLK